MGTSEQTFLSIKQNYPAEKGSLIRRVDCQSPMLKLCVIMCRRKLLGLLKLARH